MSAAGRGREAGLYYYFYFILFPFLSFGGVWFTHFTHFTYIREGRIRILRCIYLFSHSHSTFARSSIRLARVIKINKEFLIFFSSLSVPIPRTRTSLLPLSNELINLVDSVVLRVRCNS